MHDNRTRPGGDRRPSASASGRAYLRAGRGPSSARGLHHIALLCSDVERTVRFYQDVLEFPLTEIFENRDYKGSNHFFFDIGNGNLLAFFDLPGLDLGPYAEVLGGLHHIAISVEPATVGAAEGQPGRGRGGVPGGERDVDLLPRPRRRPPRADRRPAGRDVRHEGALTWLPRPRAPEGCAGGARLRTRHTSVCGLRAPGRCLGWRLSGKGPPGGDTDMTESTSHLQPDGSTFPPSRPTRHRLRDTSTPSWSWTA